MDSYIDLSWRTYLAFGAYLFFMIGVGVYFVRKSSASISHFLLGGRGLGSWVTAFSAEASDMSGWLLMGLPGAIYMSGMNQSWIAIGLFLGTFANWVIVARRLRVYTGELHSMTMIGFLDQRVRCPKHLIRVVGGAITLLFFLVYSASGLVAAGKLFESMFHMDYRLAVAVGTGVMMIYMLLGGYLAVCWTDFFQGILMFFALVVMPIYAWFKVDTAQFMDILNTNNVSLSLIPKADSATAALCIIISAAVWGLGYFGQPHILLRFMGINSDKQIPKATIIATVWVFFSLVSACFIGLIARFYFPNIQSASEAERVFILMIGKLFNPFIAGIFLAAIMAAIMSTIDSQLLVCSSTITSDLFETFSRTRPSDRTLQNISRISLVAIALLAASLAFKQNQSIFALVTFAWGGFGAAFGPAIIMSLFSRRLHWISLLAGIISGTAVSLIWKLCLHYDSWMYEILPGFIANMLVILVFNCFIKQQDPEILAIHDRVASGKAGQEESGEHCCCCCDK